MRVVLYKWFRLSNDGPTATPIEVVIKIVSSMGVERTDRRGGYAGLVCVKLGKRKHPFSPQETLLEI